MAALSFGKQDKIRFANKAGAYFNDEICAWTHLLWRKLNGLRIVRTTINYMKKIYIIQRNLRN